MTSPLPQSLSLARRVVAHERLQDGSTADCIAGACRIYATLFQTLAPLLGHAAVRALFARSLKLAQRERSGGMTVDFREDQLDDAGLSQRLTDWLATVPSEDATAVVVDLYARFLGLLMTFIGERLVLQLLKKAFPALDAPSSIDAAGHDA